MLATAAVSTSSSPLDGLNPAQREAAENDDHTLVVACPGSGKTKMLAAKAARILAHPATRVLAVTFTKDAANEMRERILRAAGEGAKQRLLCSTFHGLCWKMLGGTSLAIVKEAERVSYVRRALETAQVDLELDQALQAVDRAKIEGRAQNATEQRLLATYTALLARNHKCDFTDLVVQAVAGLRTGALRPYAVDYMLVDEFQDTDLLQYEWIAAHAKAGARVTAVGDDDQTIYSWRQAMGYAGMERFADEHRAARIVLGTNYRSRAEILAAAGHLILRNVGRTPKILTASRGSGGTFRWEPFADAESEAYAVGQAFESIQWGNATAAVIARTNLRLNAVEAILTARKIPFVRLSGGSLFAREEAAIFLDLARVVCGQGSVGVDHALAWSGMAEDDLAVLHEALGPGFIVGARKDYERLPLEESAIKRWKEFAQRYQQWRALIERGHDGLVIEGLAQWLLDHAPKSKAPGKRSVEETTIGLVKLVLESMDGTLARRVENLSQRRKQTPEATQAIALTTMHGAKGLEWDRVWIIGAEETVAPNESAPVEEERRLFYVAMTRAREDLTISATAANPVSRFVHEAQRPVEELRR